MANSPQSIKRARQAISRKRRNQPIRTFYRTVIKQARANATDPEKSADAYKKMQSIVDRTARKGLVHKNTVARIKSRLSRAIALSAKTTQSS